MLEIRDICYKIGNKEVLKGVSLKVGKNEIHSILGVNGTGKTTLAYILMGVGGYKPTSGSITFNSIEITNLSISERAKLGITLAWQSPAHFEGITVKEYLNLAKSHIEPKRWLRSVGLNPNLYVQRIVNSSLSGGERKRIELASVISISPKLAILDEPDSGIDMVSIKGMKGIIRNFKEIGASVVLITHREEIADVGDRASLLCDGKIVKQGNPKEVRDFFKKHCAKCNHVGELEEELLK